ncbi:MAG: 1,2-phenylacetyl-CoA epoxidase subunit PaaD [Flavobacteriales bacterium]|nr:1,2-phenylacetyl-CoA epoxidase subunit PaaD [Flavobacteriales bacterium]
MNQINVDEIWTALGEIEDPEIPVISIVELGVVRDIQWNNDSLEVTITPTYSGCPALKAMEDDIVEVLNEFGIEKFEIKTTLTPAWTTDWINEDAREKLRIYGIAPPLHSTVDKLSLVGRSRSIACPQCKSTSTSMISQFGSTACKALYKCNDCLEPFDYFKCI